MTGLRERLLGRWSTEVLSPTGPMEDNTIAFKKDGTGWYSYEIPFLCKVEPFRWTLERDRLSISSPKLGERFKNVGVAARFVKGPYGKRLRALQFDRGLWIENDVFGFESKKPADLRVPRRRP